MCSSDLRIAEKYSAGRTWWLATQVDLDDQTTNLASSDLIITIGGDGTILRGAHAAASQDIPVLGTNMGRVGFMSDVEHENALDEIGWYLDGNSRIEQRFMVKAVISNGNGDSEPLLVYETPSAAAAGAEE